MARLNWLLIFLAVGLICLAVYMWWDSSGLSEELKQEREKTLALEVEVEEITKKNSAEIERINSAHEARIAELNGMIDSSATVIAELEEEDAVKAKKIADLEALGPQVGLAEEVDRQRRLVEEWKGRFNLAQLTIAEKDRQIEALQKKFSLAEQRHSEVVLRLEDTIRAKDSLLLRRAEQVQKLESAFSRRVTFARIERVVSIMVGLGLAIMMID